MKKIALLLFLNSTTTYSQVNEIRKLSFEQLQDSIAISPKPILIQITTSWCTICKLQKQQISKDKKLTKILSTKYYFLELDAETKTTILFNKKWYRYIANGLTSGINELAFELGNKKGQLSYPTWVILNKEYQVIFQHQGLIKNNLLN